jgi:hypothetical protein
MHQPPACPNTKMVVRTKRSSPARRRTNRRSHFQDLEAKKRRWRQTPTRRRKAPTKRRLAPTKWDLSTKSTKGDNNESDSCDKDGGSLHLPPPYIAPALTLHLPGPTVTSIQKHVGSRATATNQKVTRHQCNGLIRVI